MAPRGRGNYLFSVPNIRNASTPRANPHGDNGRYRFGYFVSLNPALRLSLMSELPPDPPKTTIPEVKQIAACYGYGSGVADSIYALCVDGSIWARLVTRDSRWEQVSLEMTEIVEERKSGL
jgi:hypothetical protein